MPRKFVSCVKKVSRSEKKRYGRLKYNPYAVCRVSTGYLGSTHHIGMVRRLSKKRCSHCPVKELL
jgi:hypothetical protein